MTKHADVEALSAYIDGEAPEWAEHVAGCAACRATADELRAVASAVGAPVVPPAGLANRAVEVALGGAVAGPAAAEAGPRVGPRSAPRPSAPSRTPWLVGAVAAVILMVVGATAVLSMNGGSTSRSTTAAGPALDSTAEAGNGTSALAQAAPAADLGDVPDAATLVARARPALSAKSAAPATPLGAPAPAPAPASPGAAASAGASAPPTAAIVGARPCEAQARARQPSLGAVVYFATARRGGVPAVVLGFSTGSDPAQVTLLLLAQDGCAELLRAAGP